jgi:Putative peptidoglycan binding domain
VPKALVIDDDDAPRRRGRSKRPPVDVEVERNLVMRALLHSPKDTLAGAVALAGVVAIIVNAMFMQAGRHPAPMFNTAFPVAAVPVAAPAVMPATAAPTTMVQPSPLPRPRPLEAEPKSVEKPTEAPPAAARIVSPAAGPAVTRPPASIAASTHSDPVGDLIVSARRIAAVQRALTEFGYGQLKPTGVAGTDTQAAIQKFERERKLPVTGQISDRLIRELDAVTGRTIN